MRSTLIGLALGVVVVYLPIAACTSVPSQEPAEPSSYERTVRSAEMDGPDGETLYARLCASCHGLGGQGDGPVAEYMVAAIPDLTRLAEHYGGEFPLARVEDTIRGPRLESHGASGMPVWGPALMSVKEDWPEEKRKAFTADRIRRLAEHLESIQAKSG